MIHATPTPNRLKSSLIFHSLQRYARTLWHTRIPRRRVWSIANERVRACMPKWNPGHVFHDNTKKKEKQNRFENFEKYVSFIQIYDFSHFLRFGVWVVNFFEDGCCFWSWIYGSCYWRCLCLLLRAWFCDSSLLERWK